MTVLDASSLISLLARQPAAEHVAELLREPDAGITSAQLAETIDRMERVEGYPSDELLAALDTLIDAGLSVLPIEHQDGRRAGELRAHYDNRRTRPISLADCLLLACALRHDARIATSDRALAGLARELSVEVLALPDSAGRLA